MKDVRVRNVDDAVIEAWRERARQNGRSLQQELHAFLSEEAMRPRRELVDQLRQLDSGMIVEGGEIPDSTILLREERERRG